MYLYPPPPLFLALSSISPLLCWTPKLKQVKYWNLFNERCCLLPLICSCSNETLIVSASHLVVKLLRHKPDTLGAGFVLEKVYSSMCECCHSGAASFDSDTVGINVRCVPWREFTLLRQQHYKVTAILFTDCYHRKHESIKSRIFMRQNYWSVFLH